MHVFVNTAILLVARVCLFRRTRGLCNFASPGNLIHVAIGVIALVQSHFTARCRRRRHQHSLPVVPHALVEQTFVMVADASGDINLGAKAFQTIRINPRVVFEFVVGFLFLFFEVYELILYIRFDRFCHGLVHHRTRFCASKEWPVEGATAIHRGVACPHRTAVHWWRTGGAAAWW